MTMRRIVVLAAAIVCLAGMGLAQDEELPVRNWAAPPYWSPGAAARGVEAALGIRAGAQGIQAHAMNGVASRLPFVTITPCRIVDTRTAISDGFHQPNFIDGEARTFPFPTSPDCPGLPGTAGAYSVNIQFRPMSQLSYLTAYPTGTTMPPVSTLTAGPSAWGGNAAIVPAGTGGAIDIYCQYAGRVVIDINGYYTELLPYSGSGSTSAGFDLFAVENAGAGDAIHGIASSATGVFGESSSGNGVRGVSASGPGGVFTGQRGIQASGIDMGGSFTDGDNSGYAYVGYGDIGIAAYGNLSGGYFRDPTNSGEVYTAYGDYGVRAFGNTAGGYFKDADNSGYAYLGYGNDGVRGYGTSVGGYFADSDGSGLAAVGQGDMGIEAHGTFVGGRFIDSDSSGWAHVAYGDYGVWALGNTAGGYFKDADHSGYAYVGYGDYGVRGFGNYVGGYFKDADGTGAAYAGDGDLGIAALGSEAGAYFQDSNDSGYAYVGIGNRGIEGYGTEMGGYFRDSDSTSEVFAANGNYGIWANGTGYFCDLSSQGYAYVGYGELGIDARGTTAGGHFRDSHTSVEAYIAVGETGIAAGGTYAGGYFTDANSSGEANVAYSTYKIAGTGSVSFLQNHPSDPGAVIVYAAPEGDEVATYTRGSARLVGGEARVPLGETFKWVTNPDLGLTAHVTPRGDCKGIYVASLSTEEMVVKELGGGTSDATFDYLVYGLRIGFEESTVVQEKQRESYIPSMKDHRELLAKRPDLARYTALSRYSTERQAMGITEPLKLDRANALKAAIHEFDPAADTIKRPQPPEIAEHGKPTATGEAGKPGAASAPRTAPRRPDLVATERTVPELPAVVGGESQDIRARSFSSPREQLATRLAVSSSVEPGDVLVVDRQHPELFARGDRSADPTVVGVVVADAGVALGAQGGEGFSAPVALSGIARCKADASFGAILPGDLLVSSPTPGHAMREASPLPGTVVGKALEPLPSGTGAIRILVMLR